jgi:hypothetical protein
VIEKDSGCTGYDEFQAKESVKLKNDRLYPYGQLYKAKKS